MSAVWDFADFDDHEHVHMFRDRASGLTAVIAVHSTHLGPGAGGVRYWHYPQRAAAITDALRLSRGMSYKNAMAGLPMGGGKGVILADENGAKTPELLAAFGRAVESLGGAYVTAEDVGITDADMVEIAKHTTHVSGLPVASGEAGGFRSVSGVGVILADVSLDLLGGNLGCVNGGLLLRATSGHRRTSSVTG